MVHRAPIWMKGWLEGKVKTTKFVVLRQLAQVFISHHVPPHLAGEAERIRGWQFDWAMAMLTAERRAAYGDRTCVRQTQMIEA